MDADKNLSEDLEDLSLDRYEVSIQQIKTQEEIDRLTVDEKLKPIERSVYLLSSGQEVQRISVITALPDLLRENNADCMRRVVPKVREVLHVAQTEMQLAACSAFLQILQNQLVPIPNYTQTFLQTILMSLDSKDPDVAQAWLETLLDVIDLLPKDVIKKDVLNIAISKGQLSQTVKSRLCCCEILGKVATKFEPFVIKKDILPVVQSLCQDVDYEVRGCMCRQLDKVARGLGLEQTKSAILPELVDLTNDERAYVRIAGLETVVNILTLLDEETCVNTIIPLVCKFCQQAMANDDSTLPTVAKQLGKLCDSLSKYLNDEQKSWLVGFYRKLCRVGVAEAKKAAAAQAAAQAAAEANEEETHRNNTCLSDDGYVPDIGAQQYEEEEDPAMLCRRHSGFNFPAMVLFVGNKSFKSELYSAFTSLSTDPNYKVRRTVACGFHEICKILGNSSHVLISDLVTLLKDDSIEVLQGLVSHLSETLEILHKAAFVGNSEARQSAYHEIINAIVHCDNVISSSNNWRLQAELMEKLSCLPSCFNSEEIYHKFIPLVFSKLRLARALPVKYEAARTLLILLRNNRRLAQREELCDRIVEEFCRGRSCRDRSLFVDICKIVMELFSRAFFKEHFFEDVLTLATDKVPNVRLRLCPLLPKLKTLIKLPTDRNFLQKLEECVRKILLHEKDRDVLYVADKAVAELDSVQVHMESLTKKAFMEEDLLDQKKEEEEKKLIEIEEKEKKEEEVKSAKGERKKGDKSKDSKIPAPKRGSKIPAATSLSSKEKISTRTERSGSFGGSPTTTGQSKDVKRSPSFNNKLTATKSGKPVKSSASIDSPKLGIKTPGSASSRKGSASSTSSVSSVGSTGSRRGSLGPSSSSELKKSSSRRISTGSLGPNGSISTGVPRKKKEDVR